MKKTVPVLFLIFKRKAIALKAFEPIRQYQPERLYIAADGPRNSIKGEKEDCEAARNAILNAIDWDCEVKTLFREKNIGCKVAGSNGISWLFEHEEYGVIVEDDIVLSQDFFKMCEQLLPLYNNVENVMVISARNHSGKYQESDEYCFVNYANIWGWATWRRAWQRNSQDFEGWSKFPKRKLVMRYGLFQGLMAIWYYNKCSNPKNEFGGWDYTWRYNIAKCDGIAIAPRVNLSTNIGIGVEGGTNFSSDDVDPYSHLSVGSMIWPLKLKDDMSLDKDQMKADQRDFFRIRMIGLRKKVKKLFLQR